MHDGGLEFFEDERAHWIAFVRLCSVGRGCAKEHPVQMSEKVLSRAPKRVSVAYCEKYVMSGLVVGTVRGLVSR